jgi:hypothetical protein
MGYSVTIKSSAASKQLEDKLSKINWDVAPLTKPYHTSFTYLGNYATYRPDRIKTFGFDHSCMSVDHYPFYNFIVALSMLANQNGQYYYDDELITTEPILKRYPDWIKKLNRPSQQLYKKQTLFWETYFQNILAQIKTIQSKQPPHPERISSSTPPAL